MASSAPLQKATHLTTPSCDHLSLSKGTSKISQAGVAGTYHPPICPLLATDLVWWCCPEQRARKGWLGTGWALSAMDLSHTSDSTRSRQPSGQQRSSHVSLHGAIHPGQPATVNRGRLCGTARPSTGSKASPRGEGGRTSTVERLLPNRHPFFPGA